MKDDKTLEQKRIAMEYAVNFLRGKNFAHLGAFMFSKGGKVYDLSAADLSQIDLIEREGLFIIK